IELGVITDWFLFNDSSMRIAPPLTISESEIRNSCELILKAIG
ncbi:MAG: aspartate aminotransferase family protein, partial [Cyclobacteriaceae bacterium]